MFSLDTENITQAHRHKTSIRAINSSLQIQMLRVSGEFAWDFTAAVEVNVLFIASFENPSNPAE